MIAFKFKHVCLESWAVHFPETAVSSTEIEDRLAPVYDRLKIPAGTLEKLSGIRTRFLWDRTVRPSVSATTAAQSAIEKIGFEREHLKALFNCSVSRDFFEPATACLVHRNLNFPETTLAMDITNACIGFSNGLLTLGSLIESGVVKAGVVVSAENISPIVESNIEHIVANQKITREDMLKLVPTFTLGCGAVAYVLCHESISKEGHRLVGSVARSATEFNDLCAGSADCAFSENSHNAPLMRTESAKLILSAAKLGSRMWPDASEVLGWSRDELAHIFCHQVGKQVNEAFYAEMGLPMEKEFTIYKTHGNMVSAALPSCVALGVEQRKPASGDKLLLTAFGSGLNSIFTGIQW